MQPYVALLFKNRGLNEEQIGYALGMSGWAIMLSLAVITLIADARVSPSRLLAGLTVLAAGSVLALVLGLLWKGFRPEEAMG